MSKKTKKEINSEDTVVAESEEEITLNKDQAREMVDEFEKLKEELSVAKDNALRWQAEFENYKRRNATLRTDSIAEGERDIAKSILHVIDNLERALAIADESSLKDGVTMTHKLMLESLAKHGVEPIDCVGKPFDPNIHEAVISEPSEEYESGTVSEELQKGYMHRDRVLRPSMVKVAQ